MKTKSIIFIISFFIIFSSYGENPKRSLYLLLQPVSIKTASKKEKQMVIKKSLTYIKKILIISGAKEFICREKNGNIEISIDKVLEPEMVVDYILGKDIIQLRFVHDRYTAKLENWLRNNYPRAFPETKKEIQKLIDKLSKRIQMPSHLEILPEAEKVFRKSRLYIKSMVVLFKKVEINSRDIAQAEATKDYYGNPAIIFQATKKGKYKFMEATAAHHRTKRLAIILLKRVISMPRIAAQINSGNGMISGNISEKESQFISRLLNIGPPPVAFKVLKKDY